MLNLLPRQLLDEEGYPTDEYLQFIRDYKPDESLPLMKFLDEFIYPTWNYQDWGFKWHRKYNGKRKLEFHTGGWSGNESIINAIGTLALPMDGISLLFSRNILT